MRQFGTIYRFELMSYLRNKIFVAITIVMVVIIGGVLSLPRIMEVVRFSEESVVEDEGEFTEVNPLEKEGVLFIADEGAKTQEELNVTQEIFSNSMWEYEVQMGNYEREEIETKVATGEYKAAIILHSPTEYTYIANDIGMYDSTEYIVQETMRQKYQMDTMASLGLTIEEANDIMNTEISGEVIMLGKNQMENFFYTYILIFGLYMAILLYGQFVATSVATEKSSRAMELLITSAKTNNLMFGKVLGAGTAGLIQIVAILGVAFIGYGLNQSYWIDNMLVQSIFGMPLSILVYTVIFFILGFAIYSFLYGAVGSLASKVEDINTSVMPITFLFIIAFFIVIGGMTSGNVDTPIMVFASYFPFTSPMAMFTRIAMGNVAMSKIVISIIILIISTVAIGILSSRIYRLGVLMYGNPPKIRTVLKLVFHK